MKILPIILARSGSKRLPGKNFIEVDGESLVTRAVRALAVAVPDAEVVVVGDNGWRGDQVDEVRCHGRYIDRPDRLAEDTAGSWEVVRWVLSHKCEETPDKVALVQCTTMGLTSNHIRECLRACEKVGNATLVDAATLKPNGGCYVREPDLLERLGALVPVTGLVDVDTIEDMQRWRAMRPVDTREVMA